MLTAIRQNPALLGSLSAVIAVICFSTNDVIIKFLSGGYALHQVVLIRSVIGILFLTAFLMPFAGGPAAIRTRRPLMHLLRGMCVVFSNMCFFLGLAALPLAEGVAIFFISPMVITVFSVIFLGETVGPRRWAAVGIGLVGVIIVLRPGSAAFQWAALLPLLAAFGYAALHILTRLIGKTESALALSFHIQLVFLMVSAAMGLAVGDGRFGGTADPSLEFLLRAWVWPPAGDYLLLFAIGLSSAVGGYFISQAYRSAEAALVAPFEYLAMPMAVIWGILIFGEWPDAVALCGIALILGSGLYMIWREAQARRAKVPDTPRYRR